MKTLIINADDYGRTAAISRGIRHAHLHGLVSATTTMMNYPTAQGDLGIAMEECPRLGLGVHLTLTSGFPVLPAAQIPTLTVSSGAFLKQEQLMETFGEVNPAELKAEWRAQIEKFLATGATIDHLDSHHHSSYFTEMAMSTMLDLANEYGVGVRRPRPWGAQEQSLDYADRLLEAKKTWCPDNFLVSFYDDGATAENLLNMLNTLPDGVTEIMSHPGYVDDQILNGSIYSRQRERELDILTSAEARAALVENGISLQTFRAAQQAAG